MLLARGLKPIFLMSKQQQANQAAWTIFQDARKGAAAADNLPEWQRLYRLTKALEQKEALTTKIEYPF